MSTSCIVPAELKNMLKYKEELLTDMKNLLYRCSDDVELLAKQLEDADQQPMQCMVEEKELRQKQLEELQEVAQVVVNMVDPLEEGVVNNRTLLEHLHEAPQKIALHLRSHQDLCGALAWTR
jgi:DNA-directed RNA polymerase sigma subunit (sigma70/sigma32)